MGPHFFGNDLAERLYGAADRRVLSEGEMRAALVIAAGIARHDLADDLLSDATLDTLLARDGVTKDELQRVIEDARETLARVPRSWCIE